MTAMLYISYGADLAAVILMIIQIVRTRKLSGEKGSVSRYFRAFSWMVLFMSVLHFLRSCVDMELGVYTLTDFQRLPGADQSALFWLEVSAGIIDIFLTTVFLYMWISFLCWYLFDDRDFLRRKFWFGFMPLIVSAAAAGISIPAAVLSEGGFWFYIVAVCLFFFVRILYFFIGLSLLREYKKQNGYLRFFNPWVFFIPVFAGWILQDIFYLGFSALGCTLGVMLHYSSITGAQRYMDPETGFYNMDFTRYLKGLMARKKYSVSSAMTFTLVTTGKMKEFSEILKKQLPKDCEPIRRDDQKIVVLTNVREKGPLFMVTEDVKEACSHGLAACNCEGAEQLQVKTGCVLKKKSETDEEFMERVL